MTYERLTSQDRLFLDFEDPLNNMHIAGCFVFEGGALAAEGKGVDVERISNYIESRLYRIPRYRQRIESTPYEGHPIWVDDASFNIHYHVRHTRLPLPGDERQLKRLCGRIVSQQLDRHKPLWELWLVEGLEDDRFAVITKVHHCLADGISGVDLLQNLLSVEPTKQFDPPPTWLPQPEPESGELLFDAVSRRLMLPLAAGNALLQAVRDPVATADRLRDAYEGFREVMDLDANPASETPLNRRLGPHRRYDWLAFDLQEMKRVRRATGGTLNDLVLAIVAGAVGRFFERRGIPKADQESIDFRITCPTSLRADSDRETYGNQVSMLFVPVPIAERDPIERLAKIRRAMEQCKGSKQAAALAGAGDWIAPTVLAALAKRSMERHASNLVVTNVPGPAQPLYLLEARMLETYPVVPLMHEQAIAIALISYCGGLYWGVNSDWDLVPDLHDFIDALRESYEELRAAALDESDAD
jgi:WS/DGAT/MGAT family acyltransferase